MSETREVFEMVTKQTEPDLDSWRDQEQRRRKRERMRKAGAFAVVAALVVAGGAIYATTNDDPTTSGIADQPTESPPPTISPEDAPIASAFVQIVDVATGGGSTIPIVPSASAIDVSPDGTQIAYVADNVVNIADIDGSNDREVEGTRGDPGGPQWSPDGSSIVYQGPSGSDVGDLFVVELGSGRVRQITDLEGVETENLDYLSPTFDATGSTVMFHVPTMRGGQERYDLWSVPVTGGELTLVRRGAVFGDYSPDGTQIAFVEDGEFGDLSVAPTDGGEARKLASGGMVVPRWSPDGTRIAYNGNGSGVYVVDVETGEETLVVENIGHLPTWIDDDTLALTP